MPLEKMPARQAFVFLKGEIMRGRDEEEQLEIEAILGDQEARKELDNRRREKVDMFEFEVA